MNQHVACSSAIKKDYRHLKKIHNMGLSVLILWMLPQTNTFDLL